MSKIYFDFGKSGLDRASRKRLARVAEFVSLSGERVSLVKLTGYTDRKGFRRYNRRLATQRANAVKDYLIKQGVPRAKIEVVAHGEIRLPRAQRKNIPKSELRRVDVELL